MKTSSNTAALSGKKTGMKQEKVSRMCYMAMLAAISIVLVLLIRFPLFPAASYLEYDMADVPVLLGAFLLGPGAGLGILFVVSVIQAFLLGGNGIIGLIMHFVASGAMLLVASTIYRVGKEKTWVLILGLVAGSLARALIMIPFNLFFTPILFGVERQFVVDLLLPILIPFNLLAAGINSAIFFFLYKSLRFALGHAKKLHA